MTGIDPAATDALRDAAAQLASIQREILAVYDRADDRADDSWRRALIALRRRLQQETQRIAELFERVSARDAETLALRAAFDRMRSSVALHQANWPAVTVDRDDPAYQASVGGVRTANRAFAALILRLPRHPR